MRALVLIATLALALAACDDSQPIATDNGANVVVDNGSVDAQDCKSLPTAEQRRQCKRG